MPRRAMESLTGSMFYVLMAFCRGPRCGIEVMDFVETRTGGRVRLGPATLYTILAKFQEAGYLLETAVEGRKRTYKMTEVGAAAYREELERLKRCVADAAEEDAYEGI